MTGASARSGEDSGFANRGIRTVYGRLGPANRGICTVYGRLGPADRGICTVYGRLGPADGSICTAGLNDRRVDLGPRFMPLAGVGVAPPGVAISTGVGAAVAGVFDVHPAGTGHVVSVVTVEARLPTGAGCPSPG